MSRATRFRRWCANRLVAVGAVVALITASLSLGAGVGAAQADPSGPPAATITTNPSPVVLGQVFTATAQFGAAVDTGQIAHFTWNGNLYVAIVIDGSASITIPPMSVMTPGTTTMDAWALDTNGTRVSGSIQVTVGVPTTTGIAAPSVRLGETALLTATVQYQGLTAGPAGTVGFTQAGQPISGCEARPLSVSIAEGVATCEFTPSASGTVDIEAQYSGTNHYLVSSASGTVTVLPGQTQVLTDAPPAAEVGDSVLLSAALRSLTPDAPIGGQDLTFVFGGVTCLGTTSSDGRASCSLTATSVGTPNFTASYAGSDNYEASNATSGVPVTLRSTSTALTVPATAEHTTPVELTATVGNTLAPQTGTVAFALDGAPAAGCDAVPLTDGAGSWVASCTVPSLPVGTTAVTADYSGDAQHLPSSAAPASVRVTPAVTALSYTGDTAGTATEPFTLSATASNASAGGSPLAGQNVTFTVDGSSCTAATDASGIASCSVTPPRAGTFDITVRTAGDSDHLAATARATATVAQAATTPTPRSTTALTYTGDLTGTVGMPMQVSAELAVVPAAARLAQLKAPADASHGPMLAAAGAPASPVAGRTLRFTFGDASCSAVTDAAGTASCTLTPASASQTALRIDFDGDTELAASTALPVIAIQAAPEVPPTDPGEQTPNPTDPGAQTPNPADPVKQRPASTATQGLASTGASVDAPMSLVGLALLAGLGLVVLGRRRSRSRA